MVTQIHADKNVSSTSLHARKAALNMLLHFEPPPDPSIYTQALSFMPVMVTMIPTHL